MLPLVIIHRMNLLMIHESAFTNVDIKIKKKHKKMKTETEKEKVHVAVKIGPTRPVMRVQS